MPYSAQISRTSPACILFLLDQSGSMAEPFGSQPELKKSTMVADAINRLIQNLVLRCAKADGVRDYFHVGAIGYGKTVKSCLGGKIPFEVLQPISKLSDHPLRIETREKLIPDGAGGVIEQRVKFPIWLEAEANGRTPVCEALSAATLVVMGFLQKYPNSYPPIVLNLTDGRPSDGIPLQQARALRKLATSDGETLLFNLLLSTNQTLPIYFLSDDGLLIDAYAKLLFRMSSVLPPRLLDAARADGIAVEEKSRGVVFNADPAAVVRFLDIGTRVSPVLK